MRFVYFHQYFSTPRGAIGTRSYEFARRLVSRGHSVLIVCLSEARADTGLTEPFARGSRRGVVDGIEVLEFAFAISNADDFIKRTITFLRFAVRSVGVALREPYDVLFATSTPLTAGIPGIFARVLRRKPFVFEVRDLWPELPRAMGVITNPAVLSAMSILEWCSYRSATRLVGLSPGIVDGITRRGVDPSRVALIPNGCDLELFDPTAEPWRPAGVADTDFMALFAGAHGVANGLDAILDAAAVLQSRGRTDIKLVLIGEGKLKPRLQQRAMSEGLGNVVFAAAVNKTRLAGLMNATDLGLQVLANVPAFYYGTSPNKFFDYLAAGLPVLINYPGWLAELVEEHDCGYAVPPDDPARFADALERAAADRDALAEQGRRARALAASMFDRRLLSEQFAAWVEAAGRE
jgi:glycosyltransferase involved in cell wall biosynthesis